MVKNDLYRLEQQLAHVLYLLKRNKTYDEHKRELALDPTNIEFRSMQPLHVYLCASRMHLNPVIDQRVVEMIEHPDFFNDALEFA